MSGVALFFLGSLPTSQGRSDHPNRLFPLFQISIRKIHWDCNKDIIKSVQMENHSIFKNVGPSETIEISWFSGKSHSIFMRFHEKQLGVDGFP